MILSGSVAITEARLLHSRQHNEQQRNKRAECFVEFGSNLKGMHIRLQDKPHVIAKLLAEGRKCDGKGVVNACKIHWDKRLDTFHFLYCGRADSRRRRKATASAAARCCSVPPRWRRGTRRERSRYPRLPGDLHTD